MQVFEIESPIMAYAFVANADGTNYDDLSAEVIADGGVIEQVADDLVVIKIGGANITLPLGFAVVLDGTGVGKVMNHDKFTEKYVAADGLDVGAVGADVALVERVTELEKQLADVVALGGRLVAVETAVASITNKNEKTGKTKVEKEANNG